MDFSEVENLNQEEVMSLYDDIMEFVDDERLAGCCCDTFHINGHYYSGFACYTWCRTYFSTCRGWSQRNPQAYNAGCEFRC